MGKIEKYKKIEIKDSDYINKYKESFILVIIYKIKKFRIMKE